MNVHHHCALTIKRLETWLNLNKPKTRDRTLKKKLPKIDFLDSRHLRDRIHLQPSLNQKSNR